MKRFAVILALIGSLLFTQKAAADLITNGGFEPGNFTGWTQSGNWDYSGIVSSLIHTGNYAASLGPFGSFGFLSQTLTTTPGSFYNVSFWLYNQGGTPNVFGVMWDDSTIFNQTNTPGQEYTEYTLTTIASTSITELTFVFRHDPGHFFLDDVSVNLNFSESPDLSPILPPIKDPVPLPSTILFFGSGLLAFVGWRKFRKG